MMEWILSSWILILVVILLRRLSKGRISSRLRYALWLPVLLRLLIPVSFGSLDFSAAEIVPRRVSGSVTAAMTEPLAYVDYELPDLAVAEPDPALPPAEQERQYEENLAQWESAMNAAKAETGRALTMKNILLALWGAGAATVALCLLISNLRFAARLRRSRSLLAVDSPRPVYVSSAVETPCMFGLFRPAIYLTPDAAENEAALRHVIAHENTHARHCDHIWALLRGICLAIHWFAPPVWLAARLVRQDAELACDEGALHSLGENERTAYGSTLIALSTGHGNLLLTATTMCGGKRDLKERVKLIAQKPQTAAIAVVLVLIVAAAAIVFSFSGGKKGWDSVDAHKLDTGLAVNAMEGEVAWAETAYIYAAEFDHSANETAIMNVLGSKADEDTFLKISENAIHLTDLSPYAERIQTSVPYTARPDPILADQLYGLDKGDFGSEDLGFMPLKEAEGKVQALLEDMGLSGFALREAYSLDKDTLSRKASQRYELALRMSDGEVSEEDVYLNAEAAAAEEECYFFVFELRLDDIPAMTSPSSGTELDIYGVELYCLYNAEGIADLQSQRLPSAVQRVGEAVSIISAREAMAVFKEYIPQNAEHSVEELSFCYTYQDRKSGELRPTWVLKTASEAERPSLIAWEKQMIRNYAYYAIDAITGEPLIREMKLKALADAAGLNEDASIGDLKWGMTRDEVIAAAQKLAAKLGFEVVKTGDRFVTLKGYPLFDTKVDITLDTAEYSPDSYPALDATTERLLTHAEIWIESADRAYIVSQISEVLGEQETKRLVFYDHGGDFGYEFSSEIDEERDYYWCGEQNAIERLGLEALKSLYPDKSEKDITKTFYNTYEYTVYVRGSEEIQNLDEDALVVTINATGKVIADILSR